MPVSLVCVECGDGYSRPPSHVLGSRFCSRECTARWVGKRNRGKPPRRPSKPRVPRESQRDRSERLCKECQKPLPIPRNHQMILHRECRTHFYNHQAVISGRANRSAREGNRRLKLRVLAAYGGVCLCCGETSWQFLTIDHINGDGNAQRKHLGLNGSQFYRWLQKQNYPVGFRVLCFNCNTAIGFYGGCPHADNQRRLT